MVTKVFDPSFREAARASTDNVQKETAIDLRLSDAGNLGDREKKLLRNISSVNKLLSNTQKAIQDIPSSLNIGIDTLKEDIARANRITDQILDPDRDTTISSAQELISVLESIDEFFQDNPKIDIGDTTLRSILKESEKRGEGQTIASRTLTETIGEAFGKGSDFAKDLASNIDVLSRNQLVSGVDESLAVSLGTEFLGPFGIVAGQLVKDRDAVVDLVKQTGTAIGGLIPSFSKKLDEESGDVTNENPPEVLDDTVDGLEEILVRKSDEEQATVMTAAEFIRQGYLLGTEMTVQELQENHRMLSEDQDEMAEAIADQTKVLDSSLDDVEDQQKKTNRRLLLQSVFRLLGKGGLLGALGFGAFKVGEVIASSIDDALSFLTGSETSLGSEIFDLVDGLEKGFEKLTTETIPAFFDELRKGLGVEAPETFLGDLGAGLLDVFQDPVSRFVLAAEGIRDFQFDPTTQGAIDSVGDANEAIGIFLGDVTDKISEFNSEDLNNALSGPPNRGFTPDVDINSEDNTILRTEPQSSNATTEDIDRLAANIANIVGRQPQTESATPNIPVTPGSIPMLPDDIGLNSANLGFS